MSRHNRRRDGIPTGMLVVGLIMVALALIVFVVAVLAGVA